MKRKILAFLLVLAMLAGIAVCPAATATEPVTFSSVVLRSSCAGIYYKCILTEAGRSRSDIAAWGVALSIEEMPDADNMEEKCSYTRITDVSQTEAYSTLLTNVLRVNNSTEENARNLNAVIYARAYIETTEGARLFGTGVEHTFQQVLSSVDDRWAQLTSSQRDSVLEMYGTYAAVMDETKMPNIYDTYQENLSPEDPELSFDPETVPEEDADVITVGVLTNNGSDDYDTNALTLWLEEQTGYDIQVEQFQGTASQASTLLNTMIYSGEPLPDILYGFNLSSENVSELGQCGYFRDLSNCYADADGASYRFWTALDSNLTDSQKDTVIKKITASDGGMYTVPYIATSMTGNMNYQAWINTEWLDRLGLDMPTNAQELYEVLLAFRDQDPNGNELADEIPLLGSQRLTGAKLVDWLVNMFVYYDGSNYWQPDAYGQLQPVFAGDEYREALRYVSKLYQEKLLASIFASASASEMKMIATPSSGTAFCGVIVGDLNKHTNLSSNLLLQYQPLPLWGYAVETAPSCQLSTFITADCDTPNAAFQVLMALYSKAGQERMQYGAYGIDWTDADAGSTSAYGLNAEYKVYKTPDTTSVWGATASTVNRYSMNELVQTEGDKTELGLHLESLLSRSRANFDQAASNNNPAVICPYLDTADAADYLTALKSQVSRAQNSFILGTLDPCNDTDWAEYLAQLEDCGLSDCTALLQAEYDKTK